MTPFTFMDVALAPGFSLLPPQMDTPAARAMVLAICLQESDLRHRRQVNGPARGFAQFERAGILGVLSHRASRACAEVVCSRLSIPATVSAVYGALEFCDPLAVVIARLLLWTDPVPLPDKHHAEDGWAIYLRTWRPGKPHPAKWRGGYGVAWDLIDPETVS